MGCRWPPTHSEAIAESLMTDWTSHIDMTLPVVELTCILPPVYDLQPLPGAHGVSVVAHGLRSDSCCVEQDESDVDELAELKDTVLVEYV